MLLALAFVALFLAACRSEPPLMQTHEIQVSWGDAIFRMECARCHDPCRVVPIEGGERLVPYRNAHNLFEYISETMPLDKPGALPEYDYWAVTAYLIYEAGVSLPPNAALDEQTAGEVGFTE